MGPIAPALTVVGTRRRRRAPASQIRNSLGAMSCSPPRCLREQLQEVRAQPVPCDLQTE